MCLAIPGKVTEVRRCASPDVVEGRVDFGGVLRDVNLSFTPEVRRGEYVLVHVGFAIAVIDEDEAAATLACLAELDGAVTDETAPTAPEGETS